MRYAIGGITNDDFSGKEIKGIFSYSPVGSSVLLTNFVNYRKDFFRIPVFNNLSDAEKFLKELSKNFQKESRSVKKLNCKTSLFRFFLIKVDSSKFPLKLDKPCYRNYDSLPLSAKCFFTTPL